MALKNKKKKVMIISSIVIGLVLICAVIGAGYLIYSAMMGEQAISIGKYYDANMNEIKKGGYAQSVVGGTEGVKYITLKVQAKNTDKVGLRFKIIDATPEDFKAGLTLNQEQTAEAGASAMWESQPVDITKYEGGKGTFTVTVVGSASSRQPTNKTFSVDVAVSPDPASTFEVTLTPSSSGSNDPVITPPPATCVESWTCTDFGTCSNAGIQTRTCTDSKACGTTASKPSLTQACSFTPVTFETNAVVGATQLASYNNFVSGTWIKVDSNGDGTLEQWNYASSVSSTGACIGSKLTTTTDLLNVNKYTGSSGVTIVICHPTTTGQYKKFSAV